MRPDERRATGDTPTGVGMVNLRAKSSNGVSWLTFGDVVALTAVTSSVRHRPCDRDGESSMSYCRNISYADVRIFKGSETEARWIGQSGFLGRVCRGRKDADTPTAPPHP